MIWYFKDGLKPSICDQMNKQDKDLKNWQEIIKKITDA